MQGVERSQGRGDRERERERTWSEKKLRVGRMLGTSCAGKVLDESDLLAKVPAAKERMYERGLNN